MTLDLVKNDVKAPGIPSHLLCVFLVGHLHGPLCPSLSPEPSMQDKEARVSAITWSNQTVQKAAESETSFLKQIKYQALLIQPHFKSQPTELLRNPLMQDFHFCLFMAGVTEAKSGAQST